MIACAFSQRSSRLKIEVILPIENASPTQSNGLTNFDELHYNTITILFKSLRKPMIEAQNLSVVADKVTLLASVDFKLKPGKALIVTGQNGSGKSTLLRVLAGILHPSNGTALIEGIPADSRDSSFRRRVAVMIGLPPFAPDMTVSEHLLLVAATWTNTNQRPRVIVQQVLERLNLLTLSNRFPHELSSGQTQLFGIALVLVRPFDVVLLDEPEQRLDQEHLALVIEALSARRDAGATLVIATHSLELKERLADESLHLGAK